jgi:hypothetical protein
MYKTALGEIKGDLPEANVLRFITKQSWVRTILEIGTMDGTGSTTTIIESLQSRSDFEETSFISIDASETAIRVAHNNLHPLSKNVKLIHGTLLHKDSPLLILSLTEEETKWLRDDVHQRFTAPSLLETIPELIDLAIIDGGEFTSFNDYLVLRERTCLLYLHDITKRKNTLTLKTARQDGYIEMFNDGNASVLVNSGLAVKRRLNLIELFKQFT